jgi:hypothetical protein
MFAGGTSLNETRPAGILAPEFGDNSALFQHAPGSSTISPRQIPRLLQSCQPHSPRRAKRIPDHVNFSETVRHPSSHHHGQRNVVTRDATKRSILFRSERNCVPGVQQ